MEFRPEHFITDVSGKYPRLWALKGANPIDVNRWYKFGALASIRIITPGFQEISELPDYVFNVVYESWHNNPHLKGVFSLIDSNQEIPSAKLQKSPEIHTKYEEIDNRGENFRSKNPEITEIIVNEDCDDDGVVCAVCESTNGDSTDPIVLCDDCDLMVHTLVTF
ncbi:hypothetical protein ACS0TY_014727 [Phlomoides rotata]